MNTKKILLICLATAATLLSAGQKEDVAAAIARGVKYLQARQAEDGHFSDAQMPALTALPLWAFVCGGEGRTEAARKAAAYVLKTQRPDGGFYIPKPGRGGSGLGNYNTSVCMSALFESGLAPMKAILDARTYIAGSQLTGDDTMAGGFGYDRASRRRYADLSNTSYALDAMRRTEKAEDFRPKGEARADLNWDQAVKFVARLQEREGERAGGAAYNNRTAQAGTATNRSGRVELRAYGSMSYAAVLSMCHAKLTRGDPRVKSALSYCQKFWTVDENPGMGSQGLYYYFDILSRALSVAGVAELVQPDGRKVDWRAELAAKLLSLQRPDGSWENDNNRFWENDPVLATSFAILSLHLCRTGDLGESPRPAGAGLRAWADAAWTRVMATYYSAKTGNIYQTTPDKVSPARDFPGGLLKPELGYGRGLEDCAILGGVALSGLVDKWLVTRDASVPADAEKIARGLLNLATAHPYKGFVARGLCEEDGTSICRLSSRDQVTHWMHGLHRYRTSGLASDAMAAEIARTFADVAARMERNVTKENNWNFLQADGTMDPRGICKMRETHPHEAARLAMVYALAWAATGDEKWGRLYRSLREEALAGSCALGTAPDKLVRGLMPDYTLLQMNTSLEAILDVETDGAFRARAVDAMVMCARLGQERAPGRKGNDTRWLCGCAEVHLAQMMVPGGAFAYTPSQQALLAHAIVQVPADAVGSIRACHLFAAYWRARRLGLFE